MRLKVVFESSDDGGYTVHVPALPGCISEGDTVEEARDNIVEAIKLYLEDGDEVAKPPIVPTGSFAEEISI
jgi:predicted RNase H-like HicB family nuclease